MENVKTNEGIILKAVKLKELKKGAFFTRKPIAYPRDNQVFTREYFERSENKYCCIRYSDINSWIFLKGDTIVYTDFIF